MSLGCLSFCNLSCIFFLFLVQGRVGQAIKQKTPDDSSPVFSGLLQDANDRQLTIIPPWVERVLLLLGVIAIIAPGMDSMGRAHCFQGCSLTIWEQAATPVATRPDQRLVSPALTYLCFSQHYLSPRLCPPYFAAVLLLSPRTPGDQSQQSRVPREAVSSAVIVCQFAASLALLCRDTVVCFPHSLKQKAVAVAADAADGDSALALLRPP